MEDTLREQFDRAVAGDPFGESGGLAAAAMIEGAGIRRRRHRLIGAAVAAGLLVVVGVGAGLFWPREPENPVMVAAAMMHKPAAVCAQHPVERDATDAAMFLRPDVTDRQRSELETALRSDPRISAVVFESRQSAYARFAALWKDSPDFVASVRVESLPEAFRLRLTTRADFSAVRKSYAKADGVQDIFGWVCPVAAPIGGAL